jgi:hypothetical protein
MYLPRVVLSLLAALVLLISGCAAGAVNVEMNSLPTDSTLESDLGVKKFNTVRFVTVGPTTSQNIGYFLYGDAVEVTMAPGVPLEYIDGKMSLREAVADYFSQARSRGNRRINPPILREALMGGKTVGYSVADMNMGVGVWNRAGSGDASRMTLELVFDPAERSKISRSPFSPCR